MAYKDKCNLYNKYNTKLAISAENIILNGHLSSQCAVNGC